MLTLKDCQDLKKWGIKQDGNGLVYVWNGREFILSHRDNGIGQGYYHPDTGELLDFAVKIAKELPNTDLHVVGLYHDTEQWVTHLEYSTDEPPFGQWETDPDKNQALMKLIRYMKGE